ncbi:hypothetical protein AB0K80_29865 [Streptomyces sp. NPDC052682]|uniref:hypothetical protein n=1 Tax=Streptomyces sp. NPDC052682 TaxID=3154954 RepID=UPI00341D8FAF
MHRATPLALLLALGLTLAACGPGSATSAAEARPTASDDPAFLPLDAYDMTDDDARAVGRARWTLAKQCMLRLGFTGQRDLPTDPVPAWPVRPAGTGAFALTLYASDELRYGVQDPDEAAAYGYRGAQAAYERRHPARKWTLDEHLALTGQFLRGDPRTAHGRPIPERGCLGEADRRIHGSSPMDRKDAVLTLKNESLRQAERDPAWKKADRAWSACMKTAGFPYATPAEAQEGSDRRQQELTDRLSGRRTDPDEPTAREKRTAVADVRCKKQTGYVRTVHAVDVRVQNRLIARDRPRLEEQRAWNRKAVRTARALLGDDG